MKFKSLILAAAAILALAACKKEEVPTGISVDPTVKEVSKDGETFTVTVVSSEDWTAKAAKDWISGISPAAGKAGTTEVKITVAANEGKSRNSRVTFSAGLMFQAALQIKQKSALPEGDGSKDNPFSASEAHAWGVKNITQDKSASDEIFYIKGIISKIAKAKQTVDGVETSVEQYFASNTYGNASFYITDDGEPAEGEDFEAYQVNYLGNRAFNKETDTDIKVGDEVIICGRIYRYGDTIETEAKGAAFIYSLNGNVVEVVIAEPEGDGTKESPYNVAKALQECKKLKYTSTSDYEKKPAYVAGVISSITAPDINSDEFKQYGNITYAIVDEGFNSQLGVYRGLYLAEAKFTAADQIKVGDKVVIKGELCNMFGNTPQFTQGNHIVKHNDTVEPDQQTVTGSVSDAIKANDGDKVILNDGIVALLGDKGFVVTDGTSNIYVYFDALLTGLTPAVKVGDKVKIEAKKTTYNKVPELVNEDSNNKIKVTVVSSGNTVPYTEKKDITATIDAYDAAYTEYVEVKGLLNKDDKGYYNLTVSGATRQASCYAVPASFDLSKFDGKAVAIVGYYVGINSKDVVCVIPESVTESSDVKYCTIDSKTKTVKADVTSVSFDVNSNSDWTFTYSGESTGVSVDPASGNGSKSVTVTIPANESETDEKVYNFVLACEAAGVTEAITITQKKVSTAAGYQKVTSADELAAGNEFILVAFYKDKAGKETQFVNGAFTTTTGSSPTSFLASVSASVTGDVISELPDDAVPIVLGGKKGEWTLSLDGKLIGATAVKKIKLDDGTKTWTIAIDDKGQATISSTNADYGRFLYNASSPRFLNYTSATSASMLLPYIYKKQ